ncbi:hypothetical protein LPW36_17395 [Jinshanibacter sp. LJY008]|uniref:Uncharacterized protein n=1 Tax=Limnobaculum eriocheiris TaxID=2897391 RepID=A0A9X1SMA6_9GAMM|nr:hypothetical protein [Limnobaculum eriocheiris]MCD1127730.1 hypothetical protein [Limnobaculum eriocheiris]
MGDYPWRVQLLYATCLCLALLLFFLPLPIGWVVIGCVLTLLVSGYKGWRTLRYTRQVSRYRLIWMRWTDNWKHYRRA